MKKLFVQFTLLLSVACFGFSCEEQEARLEEENIVKMVIAETQCANPWESAADAGEYENNIKAYLLTNGVDASSLQVKDELPPSTALCMACSCWSGNNIYINIPASQVGKAEALGFNRAG